jgi:hypothetical protein
VRPFVLGTRRVSFFAPALAVEALEKPRSIKGWPETAIDKN